MVKIKPRSSKVIAEELALFLSKRGILAKIIKKFEEGSNIISGATEFLVGEGLARILNVNLYFDENPQKNYILWNGSVDLNNLTFKHAPKGLPDLEVAINEEKAIIEITFGIHPKTVINEIKEVLHHQPKSFKDKDTIRFLIVPSKIANNINNFINKNNIIAISIENILNILLKGKNLTLKDLIDLSEQNSGDKLFDIDLPSYQSIFEAIWEEASKGRFVFSFLILKLVSEILNRHNLDNFYIY